MNSIHHISAGALFCNASEGPPRLVPNYRQNRHFRKAAKQAKVLSPSTVSIDQDPISFYDYIILRIFLNLNQ